MKTNILPHSMHDVSRLNLIVDAKFPRIDKNNTLTSNDYEILANGRTAKAQITHVVVLYERDWEAFSKNLLTNQYWLAGKGGIIKTQTQIIYCCLLVIAPDRRPLLVDPEGHSYARIVGDILNIDSIRDIINSVTQTTIV